MSVIVIRAPLRISFGGGGTDLPSYYRRHGGFVVSAAIDRYVHMLATAAFQDRYRLKHLEWEEVDDPGDIAHPILREAITRHWNGPPLELASVADVPPGTGLGSSGAYTVCALGSLRLAAGGELDPADLAEEACRIEVDVLARTVGKQDQYVSAYGGLRAYTFNPDDSVDVHLLSVTEATRDALREEFLLFYTGEARSAADLLSHQVTRTLAGDPDVEQNLHRTKAIAREMCEALEAGDVDRCAELMNAQWEIKRTRSPMTETERVAELRAVAFDAGAGAAMLMGAGGGGFLLVHSPAPDQVRAAMAAAGAQELVFDLDRAGCAGAVHPPWKGAAALPTRP